MKTAFYTTLVTLLLVLLSGGPAFCASSEPVDVIRFGAVNSASLKTVGGKPVSTGTFGLAEELGYFREELGEHGPRVEEIFFSGTGPAQNEALAQGSIDFGSYGGMPNVLGLANGIPAHIVLATRSTGAGANYFIGVHPDAKISSIQDLRGKRITVLKGTSPWQTLLLLLEANGMHEKEVTIVNLQGNEALVAFNAGAVDAVFGGLNLLILRDQGTMKIVSDTKQFKLPASTSGTLVNDSFARKHPDLVLKVVRALLRASYWASQEEHRDALIRFVSDRSLAFEYVRQDYEGSLVERYNPLIDGSMVDAFSKIASFAYSHRLIRREVSEAHIRGWFQPQYLTTALRELGLETFWKTEGAFAGDQLERGKPTSGPARTNATDGRTASAK